MRREQEPRLNEISVVHNRKKYTGLFNIEGDRVIVRYGLVTKSSHCSGSLEGSMAVARILLRELIDMGAPD